MCTASIPVAATKPSTDAGGADLRAAAAAAAASSSAGAAGARVDDDDAPGPGRAGWDAMLARPLPIAVTALETPQSDHSWGRSIAGRGGTWRKRGVG